MEASHCEQPMGSLDNENSCSRIEALQLPLPEAPLARHESECTLPVRTVERLVIDGKGSNWHQSPIVAFPSHHDKERKSLDSLPILDFDLLCATVAMQSEPLSLETQGDAVEVGGVQRMWEGGVLDCFDNSEIALQTFCCPCVTFGKSMQRAGYGSCLGKGGIYFVLVAGAVTSYTLFLCTHGRLFLYLALLLLVSVAAYAGYFRIQIRRKFNIKGSDTDGIISAVDDNLNHFLCGCCTLCQEARTLEMNNVQDGNWHGRGDTIWVGSYSACESHDSQSPELKQPVVITISSEPCSQESAEHTWSQSHESCDPLMAHLDKPR